MRIFKYLMRNGSWHPGTHTDTVKFVLIDKVMV